MFSITVTSLVAEGGGGLTTAPHGVGRGEVEPRQGRGEPPFEEPSGEGRSMEGEGEGDGVRERSGEGGGRGRTSSGPPGVEGREAPGLMEVGRGSRGACMGGGEGQGATYGGGGVTGSSSSERLPRPGTKYNVLFYPI